MAPGGRCLLTRSRSRFGVGRSAHDEALRETDEDLALPPIGDVAQHRAQKEPASDDEQDDDGDRLCQCRPFETAFVVIDRNKTQDKKQHDAEPGDLRDRSGWDTSSTFNYGRDIAL